MYCWLQYEIVLVSGKYTNLIMKWTYLASIFEVPLLDQTVEVPDLLDPSRMRESFENQPCDVLDKTSDKGLSVVRSHYIKPLY